MRELGFSVSRVPVAALRDPDSAAYLPRLLEAKLGLLLSVNLQGLLPGGPVSKMLAQAAARDDLTVLVWFVDNPWHVLSGMRDPSWKSFTLAVTDQTFVEPLRLAGAQRVLHLPLAASPQLAAKISGQGSGHDDGHGQTNTFLGVPLREVVFAGRTAFPGKEVFFEGLTLPSDLLAEAEQLSLEGSRPDFSWWVNKLKLEPVDFWPGKKARLPGFGAAQSNTIWREQRLKAVVDQHTKTGGLTLFGDSAWERGAQVQNGLRNSAPGLDLREPFDYYASAHSLYAQAAFSLNLNSLLLGAGLTQRIFDIWLARGFCLTDNSPGLNIFPEELTAPVTFNTPEELVELIARFKGNPRKKQELTRAWQEHILREHSYTVRLGKLLC
ncbi:MAG: glycosyltransferase [Deltaproteobacteria bacterium]|jgi:hypothetical protein|nr:glycosyltransferase [Deltaproteobacteria bacterium]